MHLLFHLNSVESLANTPCFNKTMLVSEINSIRLHSIVSLIVYDVYDNFNQSTIRSISVSPKYVTHIMCLSSICLFFLQMCVHVIFAAARNKKIPSAVPSVTTPTWSWDKIWGGSNDYDDEDSSAWVWVTRLECPKNTRDKVKRPEGPPARSWGPEGP